MDEQRFDQLSRRLAGVRTRRQALKAIAGAVVASVAGVKAADAQQCTAHYSPCTGDEQCCSGAVCEYGLCMPGCRIDGGFTSAWMSPPGNICGQCRPELSTTAWTPANEGMSCWSGDPNAGATFCQGGECRATGPASCPPPPACYTDDLINPATCTYAPAPAGTVCGGQAMCHGGFYTPADTCDGNGFCVGGGSQAVSCAPYGCEAGACRTTCDADSDCLDGTRCCAGECVRLDTVENCGACGIACSGGDECNDPVCSDDACGTVPANDDAPCDNGAGTCNGGVCESNLVCVGTTPGEPACASDADCAAGELCQNGGCFVPCTGARSLCSTGCAGTNCYCFGSANGDALTCHDLDYGIGPCATNADCPAGSICDSGLLGSPYLCTRPCTKPTPR